MKHVTFLILVCFYCMNSYGQHFESRLFFESTNGQKDTLTLGYNPSATKGIDATFGELNIISKPLGNSFEARFSDVLVNGKLNPLHQSKKQIIKNDCPHWLMTNFGISVEIHEDFFPVKISWDQVQFDDSCRLGSVLTDVHPGGWFDTRGTFRYFMQKHNNITIDFPYYSYTNSSNEKIGVFWAVFMDSSIYNIPFDSIIFNPNVFTSIEHVAEGNHNINVYPNPVSNIVNFYTKKGSAKISGIELYDLQGRLVINSNVSTEINISPLKNGMYIYKAIFDDLHVENGHLIKN